MKSSPPFKKSRSDFEVPLKAGLSRRPGFDTGGGNHAAGVMGWSSCFIQSDSIERNTPAMGAGHLHKAKIEKITPS